MRLEGSAPFRQLPQRPEVALGQRFLFRPTPALQSALGRGRIRRHLEAFMENQLHRAPLRGESAVGSSVMLADPPLKARARRPDVVPAVTTAQQVDPGSHVATRRLAPDPSRRTLRVLLRMRCGKGQQRSSPSIKSRGGEVVMIRLQAPLTTECWRVSSRGFRGVCF